MPTTEAPRISYFLDDSIGMYASVEAGLLKPHVIKCAILARLIATLCAHRSRRD